MFTDYAHKNIRVYSYFVYRPLQFIASCRTLVWTLIQVPQNASALSSCAGSQLRSNGPHLSNDRIEEKALQHGIFEVGKCVLTAVFE